MNIEELIKQYVNTRSVMQLATAANNQPYVCNVHFYADDQLNFYWISTETRRHSQEIAQNPKVSAAILIHENTPAEDYVIGLTILGSAQLIGKDIDTMVGNAYISKLGKQPVLLEDIASSRNPHKFYKLVPDLFVLFDNQNFPDDPRKEVRPNA